MMGRGNARGGYSATSIGRMIASLLLIWNLLLSIIILGMAGWMLDRNIRLGNKNVGFFGGNNATIWLATFSLLAGMTSIAAIICGLHHVRLWRPDTGAAAQATAWISWLLLVLAFCLAWKSIHIGRRSAKYRVLEAFVIMLTVTKLIYILCLYIFDRPTTETPPAGQKAEMPTTGNTSTPGSMPAAPAAASAV